MSNMNAFIFFGTALGFLGFIFLLSFLNYKEPNKKKDSNQANVGHDKPAQQAVAPQSMAIPNKPAEAPVEKHAFISDPLVEVPAFLRNKASKKAVEAALGRFTSFGDASDDADEAPKALPTAQMRQHKAAKKNASRASYQSI